MLIYLPLTPQTLICVKKEAVLSPCNFVTAHLTACMLHLISQDLSGNFVTHEMEDLFATRQLCFAHGRFHAKGYCSLGCPAAIQGRSMHTMRRE